MTASAGWWVSAWAAYVGVLAWCWFDAHPWQEERWTRRPHGLLLLGGLLTMLAVGIVTVSQWA